ncbi:MAG: 2-dehydropantoate 2-reductase [Methylobacteriaceae bacterium]|jgi:2-dehydropantoate 2-reductase|nr:2-dehydropantoate 2-reductase [Methylobacteriaceae bacterium]
MRIAIMGAGGVGGYFGGRLALAGNDVTFIARGAHGEAIRRNGLRAEGTLGEFHLQPAKCVASAAEITGPVDVILFTVKLSDIEAAAEQLRPIVGPATTLYTVQNGVEAAENVGNILGGEKVVPGVAYISATIAEPGLIRSGTPFAGLAFGETDRRESARTKAFYDACKAAKFDATLAPDITRTLWSKFAMLAPMAATTTLMRCGMGAIRANPRSRALLQALVEEIVAVGKAAGVHMEDGDVAAAMKVFDGLPPTVRASMAHDLDIGKPLELPWLSGAVVRLGETHGVATPTHRFITQALAPYEKGQPE